MTVEDLKQLKYEYCYHLDSRNVSEFLALFTEDARFDVPNFEAGEGTEDLRSFIAELRSRDLGHLAHMASNPVIRIDGKEATGKWYYIVIIEDGEGNVSWGQGRWDDSYRKVDGEWKISSVIATRQFTRKLPNKETSGTDA